VAAARGVSGEGVAAIAASGKASRGGGYGEEGGVKAARWQAKNRQRRVKCALSSRKGGIGPSAAAAINRWRRTAWRKRRQRRISIKARRAKPAAKMQHQWHGGWQSNISARRSGGGWRQQYLSGINRVIGNNEAWRKWRQNNQRGVSAAAAKAAIEI